MPKPALKPIVKIAAMMISDAMFNPSTLAPARANFMTPPCPENGPKENGGAANGTPKVLEKRSVVNET